jgi:hypothetical protein
LAKVSATIYITKKRKLESKIVDCVFPSNDFHCVGYRFLVVEFEVPHLLVGKIIELRDATFFENIFPMIHAYMTLVHLDKSISRRISLWSQ